MSIVMPNYCDVSVPMCVFSNCVMVEVCGFCMLGGYSCLGMNCLMYAGLL